MSQDDQLTPASLMALRARFAAQSRKAQAYYTVMHEVRGKLGSDDAASAWMEAPLPAFEGRTAAQLVAEGREDEVLAHLRAVKPVAPR